MFRRRIGLCGAAAGILGLAAVVSMQPAIADTIDLAGWWGGHGSTTITFNGTNYHDGSAASFTLSGGAGGFLTYDLTTDPGKANSFESWCVDIFHNFSFPGISYNDALVSASSVLGASRADALGRLYTAHHSLIDSPGSGTTDTNGVAFQLAVWEIVNEGSGSYDLSSGDFKVSGTSPSAAVATATSWLNSLYSTTNQYDVSIWSVQDDSGPSGKGVQDVAVFAPVPEPESYAMLLTGLALLGFVTRRRAA